MCSCQAFGKRGVPRTADDFHCLVCGQLVTHDGAFVCPVFRPDHNGECLICDEWADAHSVEAIAAGISRPGSIPRLPRAER